MLLNTDRTPVSTFDADGMPIFLVPLANTDVRARILPDDYHALRERGVSPFWCLNDGAVKVNHRPLYVQRVARLLIQPQDGFQVRHRDGNGLNLRRDNLILVPVKPRKDRRERRSNTQGAA